MRRVNIAGLSLGGGRKDNFFFSLIEYYPDYKKWFLKSILPVKGNQSLRNWMKEFSVHTLVVDFPLSTPSCQRCTLKCPGIDDCPVEETSLARERMNALFQSGVSKAFKRRLKRDFLPYWNRVIDVWIWEQYYDLMLDYFNTGFDSFGNTSLMLISRFAYIRRHFPEELAYRETSVFICLLELLRAEIILPKQVRQFGDMELGVDARMTIIQDIARKLNIFIYDHDFLLMATKPRAFLSFLLVVAGQRVILNKTCEIPPWCQKTSCEFVVPCFV